MKAQRTPPGPSFISLLIDPPLDRLSFIQNLIKKYGDIIKMPGFVKAYIINNPNYVHHILQTHPENYLKTGKPLKHIEEGVGQGLLTNQGSKWHSCRKLVTPHFYEKNTLPYVPIIAKMTVETVNLWKKKYLDKNISFDLNHEIMKLVLNITSKLFFSLDLTDNQLKNIIELIQQGNYYVNHALILHPWFPSVSNIRYRYSKKRLHNFLQTIIDEHKLTFNSTNRPHDLLDSLLTLKNEESGELLSNTQLIDEFKTLLITGHETTGTALTWAFYLLGTHPTIKDKLFNEISQQLGNDLVTANNLKNLSYTKMVLEEALRLYPPIWLIARVNTHADEIDGYVIPPKSSLLMCTYILHRHPDYWENPNAFIPERFATKSCPSHSKHAYIPFGLGPRTCIAAAFAMLQATTILATIIQHLDFEIINHDKIILEPLVSLRSHNGLIARLRKKTS